MLMLRVLPWGWYDLHTNIHGTISQETVIIIHFTKKKSIYTQTVFHDTWYHHCANGNPHLFLCSSTFDDRQYQHGARLTLQGGSTTYRDFISSDIGG